MKKVRWGLLSTAAINRALIPAIRDSERGELVAVASRDQERAQAYAAKWEIPKAFCTYEAMLLSGAVDVAYISLPNHMHAEWSIRALEAGLHVLCEKPLALSLGEVDRMADASRRAGKRLAEAFHYRHHPKCKTAKEWVDAGRLGEICLFRGSLHFAMANRDNIRFVPEYGGGALWDVGVYPMSLAQCLFGDPPQCVSGEQLLGPTGVDETFAGQMHYSGDLIAQISGGFRTAYHRAEIFGTEGRLVLDGAFLHEHGITFVPNAGEPFEIDIPRKTTYLCEVEEMNAAILDDAPCFLTLDESRNHIRTVLALYESARTRKTVQL